MSFHESAMGKRTRRANLDLTPLIDIIFQLLVFFLLTASFTNSSSFKIDVPSASPSAVAVSKSSPLRLAITRTGKIIANGTEIKPGEIDQKLREFAKRRKNSQLLIFADKKAYHGDVVRVMDAAKRAGFSRIGVAIRPN